MNKLNKLIKRWFARRKQIKYQEWAKQFSIKHSFSYTGLLLLAGYRKEIK